MTAISQSTRGQRTVLSNGVALEELVRPDEGLISRRIFTDAEIYEFEQERVFAKGWFYVGHETEIPEPGDILSPGRRYGSRHPSPG
jgi:hypothetical protein